MATSTEDLQGLIRQARDAAAELLSEDSALGQSTFAKPPTDMVDSICRTS